MTGGAVRLGRAIAVALGRAGCDVAVHHFGSAAAAKATVAEITALGRRAVALPADSDPQTCAPLVADARRQLGGLDVLVNCAALFLAGDLATTSLATWERQLALNLRAPFLLAQAFAAALGPEESGRIVNVTDARARRPGRGIWRIGSARARSTTSPGCWRWSWRRGSRSTRWLPAPCGARRRRRGAALRVASAVPLRRAGGAEPVADAVLYFLREGFVTGVVLPVDGGEYL